jgi:hypothetical protein
MKSSWQELCREAGFAPRDGAIEVRLETGRSQRIEGEELGEELRLRSTVARAAISSDIPDLALSAWVRNRSVPLVGFRVDNRGRLVGELWVPRAGLTSEELHFLIQHLAIECDRFEFQLTGEDRE